MQRQQRTVAITPTQLSKPVKRLRSRGSSKGVMATRGSPAEMLYWGNSRFFVRWFDDPHGAGV